MDQGLILKLVEDITAQNKEIKEISQKYVSLAVIGEIAELTPSNIRLVNLSARVGRNLTKKKSKKSRDLIISGIVRGDRLTLESTLASYLMSLGKSPLFDKPTISKKSVKNKNGADELEFEARFKLS